MYCPKCRDEFREGFTRCESCGVDLVASLSDGPPPPPGEVAGAERAAAASVPMIEYCGFIDLADARGARDRLRAESVRADIVIREAPGSDLGGPAREEYWLRVERQRYREAAALLELDHPEPDTHVEEPEPVADDTFSCGDCGHDVGADETFCPNCGARFEDD